MNGNRESFSAPPRDAFREAARVNCFDRLLDSGSSLVGLPQDRTPTFGELLEGFYAAVNWYDWSSIEPFITVFKEVYSGVPENVWGHKEELTERLFQDGLQMTSGRFARLSI